MTKENLIPIENKKPFETVYELKNEVPSFEEFMKTYEADEEVNYDDLTYSDISEVKGYGPCKVCDKGESSPVEFRMACPGKNCSDKTAGYWHHNRDGCRSSRMMITSWGNLSCGNCGVKHSMANWRFACSLHRGDYRSMSQDSWEKSMGYALFMKNVNQVTRDLNVYVTNHPEKFGFK